MGRELLTRTTLPPAAPICKRHSGPKFFDLPVPVPIDYHLRTVGITRECAVFEQVLLLNASFEPLNVINWRRAVKLMFMDKVEVVAESDHVIHSVSTTMRVPSVVRLMGFVRFRRRDAKFSRRNIYARDNYRCQYCGRSFSADELTCDHVLPRSRGGRAEWANIVTSCVPCNRRKGGQTPEEAGLSLLRTPERPSWMWGFHSRFSSVGPPAAWRSYLRMDVLMEKN